MLQMSGKGRIEMKTDKILLFIAKLLICILSAHQKVAHYDLDDIETLEAEYLALKGDIQYGTVENRSRDGWRSLGKT